VSPGWEVGTVDRVSAWAAVTWAAARMQLATITPSVSFGLSSTVFLPVALTAGPDRTLSDWGTIPAEPRSALPTSPTATARPNSFGGAHRGGRWGT